MKGVMDSGQSGSCPICKGKIGLLKIPTRMVLRLIAEQEVACQKCGKNVHYEDSAAHVCGDTTAQAPAAIPEQPVIAPASSGSPADSTGCPSRQIFTTSRENLHRSGEKNEGLSGWKNCSLQDSLKGILLFYFQPL